MRALVMCLGLGCAAPVAAQDMSGAIDFDALFAAHADAVTEVMSPQNGTSRRQLEMPGGILVWADGMDGAWRYSAMDTGQTGVTCLWDAYTDLAVMHQTCPTFLTEDGAAQLEVYRRQIGDFIAANTFPPVPVEAFWSHWEAAIAPDPALDCAALMTAENGQMISTLLGTQFAPVVSEILSEQRLPVATPCF